MDSKLQATATEKDATLKSEAQLRKQLKILEAAEVSASNQLKAMVAGQEAERRKLRDWAETEVMGARKEFEEKKKQQEQ